MDCSGSTQRVTAMEPEMDPGAVQPLGSTSSQGVDQLNQRGVPAAQGGVWYPNTVRQVLRVAT